MQGKLQSKSNSFRLRPTVVDPHVKGENMYPDRRKAEKQVDTIRKKWRDYKIPPDARKQSLDLIRPFAQFSFALMEVNQASNPKKIDRDRDEFTKLVGLFSRDCFLIGMEYGSRDITEEVREFLMAVSNPLIEFMAQKISERIRLGAMQKEERDKTVQTTLEQIAELSKKCFHIGVSYNPRVMASHQKPAPHISNTAPEQQDKIRYYFAHIYLPEMFFELPQKMYENLASERGNDFLLFLWKNAAKEMASETIPSGLHLYRQKLDSNHEAFLIQMPRPRVVPEAFWGAVTFELEYYTIVPKVVSVRYFTLELGRNPYEPSDEYHFCEWSTLKEHTNYGKLSQSDMRSFVQAISSTIST